MEGFTGLAGTRLKIWIERRREEWNGPRGQLFRQRPVLGDLGASVGAPAIRTAQAARKFDTPQNYRTCWSQPLLSFSQAVLRF